MSPTRKRGGTDEPGSRARTRKKAYLFRGSEEAIPARTLRGQRQRERARAIQLSRSESWSPDCNQRKQHPVAEASASKSFATDPLLKAAYPDDVEFADSCMVLSASPENEESCSSDDVLTHDDALNSANLSKSSSRSPWKDARAKTMRGDLGTTLPVKHSSVVDNSTSSESVEDSSADSSVNFTGSEEDVGAEARQEEECCGSDASDSCASNSHQRNDGEISPELLKILNMTSGDLKNSLLILAMKMRHKLTYAAAEDVIKLSGVLQKQKILKANKYYWKKIVNLLAKGMSIHHVCGECSNYIGESKCESELEDDSESSSVEASVQCDKCGHAVTERTSFEANDFFIYMSLGQQIRNIVEVCGESCNYNDTRKKGNDFAFEDIFDGDLYKKIVSTGMLSVNFSVDGVPVFDSSGYNMTPLLCSLNNLEPKKRSEYLMLCGLWCGKKVNQANANAFLTAFVNESKELYHEGLSLCINGVKVVKKVQIVVGVSDSVERPVLRGSTQFNGCYGCGLCLHPGIQLTKGNGTVRVYPIKDGEGVVFPADLRNHLDTKTHVRTKQFGMQRRTILFNIPNFDVIQCLDLDWAHAVLFGVARQFAKLMFKSKYKGQPYNISMKKNSVDKFLLSIKPSLEVSRTPRKISQCNYWKMHEWLIWLLFYSLPTLKLFHKSNVHINHWALLVEGVSILCNRSIMRSEVDYAHRCLVEFVEKVPELYNINEVSFNVHLLTHMSQSVLRFSCLWTHSSFIYEDCYQELLSYVKSSNGVPIQVRDSFRMRWIVKQLLFYCQNDLNNDEEEFLEGILPNFQRKCSPTMLAKGAALLGKPAPYFLTKNEHFALLRIHVQVRQNNPVYMFERAVIHREVIQSKSYSRVTKRNSFVVLTKYNEIFEIQKFVVIQQHNENECYALGHYFIKRGRSMSSSLKLSHIISLKGYHRGMTAVNASDIIEKVTYFDVPGAGYSVACVHPNHTELLS